MRKLLSIFKCGMATALFSTIAFSAEAQTSAPSGISMNTIKNGNTRYPPSDAFVELLQRSAYLTKPETLHYLHHFPAIVFRAMSHYYLVQRNGTSCSLATATMILNTVRDIQSHQRLDKPATQNEVLEMVNNPLWDAATADDGPGVTLEQCGQLLKEMFAAYNIKGVSVEIVYVNDKSETMRKTIHQDLVDINNANNGTTLLALNFDDRTFINFDIDVGHISPVGGYDPVTGLVLILDVDREWTGPYWISEETMLDGMNTLNQSEDLSKPTYRGYVRIRIESP